MTRFMVNIGGDKTMACPLVVVDDGEVRSLSMYTVHCDILRNKNTLRLCAGYGVSMLFIRNSVSLENLTSVGLLICTRSVTI